MSDRGDGEALRAMRPVTLHPSSLWQALDAEAELWANETDIASWIAKMSSDPKTRQKLDAITRLCFEEGFYRGALAAARGKALVDSILEVEAERERDALAPGPREDGR